MTGKLVLIDGHSIINRAFYGMPALTSPDGRPTGAVYGFLTILFKILDEEHPDYLTVAWDRHEPTFRHEMYAEYKGTRKPMPEELRAQVPMMHEMLTDMGVCQVERAGYEADDILGTLARQAEADGLTVSIVSGDRDLLQIATDRICVRIPKTKPSGTVVEDYHASDVYSRFGVTPLQYIDVKALMGDSSDNVPGVPGIGEKSAFPLIQKWGSIDGVYEHLEEITKKEGHDKLAAHKEELELSLRLVTIKTDCELDWDYDRAALPDYATAEAADLSARLGFKRLQGRFENGRNENVQNTLTDSVSQQNGSSQTALTDSVSQGNTKGQSGLTDSVSQHSVSGFQRRDGTAQGGLTDSVSQSSNTKSEVLDTPLTVPEIHMTVLPDIASAQAFVDGLDSEIPLGLAVAIEGHPGSANILGIAVATGTECYYVPVDSNAAACKLLSGVKNKLYVSDYKNICEYLPEDAECLDIVIAAYLINPLHSDYDCATVAMQYAGLKLPTDRDIYGKLSMTESMMLNPHPVQEYFCMQAYAALSSGPALTNGLRERDEMSLYTDMERPLARVLHEIEAIGVRVDRKRLAEFSAGLSGRIEELQNLIYDLAKHPFNINSPKQLGEVLFGELGLAGGKKTKSGYSTAAEVLEKLAPDNPIVADVLEYRGLTKLKSTYADALPACIAADGRIHTTFNQCVTATGRLSSENPNLQNIPMRTELGQQIRAAFVPKEGYVFIDADYSQIELRILAHMTEDPTMIEAYVSGQDIHRSTAARVFHVPYDEVTPEQRRNAKVVNFGIIYGMSVHGLAEELGCPHREAEDYMAGYMATYPGIYGFQQKMINEASERGYSETLWHRIRPIPELASSTRLTKAFGERAAINSPIQGTAADIIKLAMIHVQQAYKEFGMEARIVLQVHDELLVEAPVAEAERAAAILTECMEHAASLKVPLEVEVHEGGNWLEAH